MAPKPASNNGLEPNTPIPCNQNGIFLALGILLLELYLDQPRYTQPFFVPGQESNPFMYMAFVHRWIQASKGDLSAAFLNAISHCLRCSADPSADLNDAGFLRSAIREIVLPLQEEYARFLGL